MSYYSLKKIDKKNADYNLIYGERSNGKTYSVVQKSLDEDLRLAYVRRYDNEITKPMLKDLYSEHWGKWKKDDYNSIDYISRSFYYTKKDEKGKIIKRSDKSICDVFCLNTWEHSKGADRGKFDLICFDEFLTRDGYLSNEVNIFKNVVSTIIRDRAGTKIYLLGNTVNKYSPYFGEFCISDDIKKLKQGEILTKTIGKYGTKVAVEHARSNADKSKVKKYFDFGKKETMITTGRWEIDTYPHYQGSIISSDIIATAYVIDNNVNLAVDIVSNVDGVFLRVRPQTKNIDTHNNICYCTLPSPNPLHTTSVYTPKIKVHKIIKDLIDKNLIYFNDNEIGELWYNYMLECRQNEHNIVYKLA